MPPSQLKRLKASLHAEGVVGPQQSKKQKKKNQTNGVASEKRAQRGSALQRIREQFNPFEVKEPSRSRDKFDVTRPGQNGAQAGKAVKSRPGVTKGMGEEVRRRTLLKDIERRNKTGGIRDRRFGEDDPTMTPEEKMLERLTREKQRQMKNDSLFNLDDEDQQDQLTHLGRSLSFDNPPAIDDFDEADVGISDDDETGLRRRGSLKRRRSSGNDAGEGSADEMSKDEPERKKSKAEVMKEVMAKSKLHKYERQQAKEDDEDVREELDKELPELLSLLRGGSSKDHKAAKALVDSSMNPQRAAFIDASIKDPNTDYDYRLRQMAMDKRSMPTSRTKTEEEKAEEEASRLRELEASRMRRMRGEEEESDEEEVEVNDSKDTAQSGDEDQINAFGLGSGMSAKTPKSAAKLEEEDEFLIDEDLVASASEADVSDDEDNSKEESSDDQQQDMLDGDDKFVQGLLSANEKGRPEFQKGATSEDSLDQRRSLAYTYPCPETHEELLQIVDNIPFGEVPTVVQRIRALYHPKLHADNRAKLSAFSRVLVDHLIYLANSSPRPPFVLLETLTRHIHSLAKTYPEDVGNSIRNHLRDFQGVRPLAPEAGDLILLAAIGTILSTSDHFHQVVTPANLCIARYLSQKFPASISDLSIGSWLQTVCLQYQRISKRYMPEVVNYTMNAISNLAPVKPDLSKGCFPFHDSRLSLRVDRGSLMAARQPSFWDTDPQSSANDDEGSKCALLETQLKLIDSMASLWAEKAAFDDLFGPLLRLVQVLDSPKCRSKLPTSTRTTISQTVELLQRLIKQARISRRPLTLHYHRPLPIKTSIPKFEESYDPMKHYDPNRDRAELSKLKAEHKRERKGAMRELRKDANFIARESLREKKERDQEYDKKYKRLVAEIQGEEGKEANLYEREKRMRKAAK